MEHALSEEDPELRRPVSDSGSRTLAGEPPISPAQYRIEGVSPSSRGKSRRPIACRLYVRRQSRPVAEAALCRVFADMDGAAILGANAAVEWAGGLSYWACEPREVFEFGGGSLTIPGQACHNRVMLSEAKHLRRPVASQPFGELQRALDTYRLEDSRGCSLPRGAFAGGWIGYFGYELSRYIERLPETTVDDLRMPLIHLAFYDRFVCQDHRTGSWYLAALDIEGDDEPVEAKFDALETLIERALDADEPDLPPADIECVDLERVRCNMDRAYYMEALARIKRHIRDGDVYQINLSQRFACPFAGSPVDLFAWQNRYNPSPFAAYLDDGRFQIVSASPEMFITLRDGWISTRPIKGTRPRLDETANTRAAALNAAARRSLLASPKEQAELNMIIDLERNDLARICAAGTRQVVEPRTLVAYPTVYHALATVAGRVREGLSFCDVLWAVFPGGSITGAPKIRAMEIIDQTEPTARGVYTGSIGFIGIDDSACLNIAIRTIILRQRTAFVQTGGGIVADSDPQDEWNETLTKARALLAGIRALQG